MITQPIHISDNSLREAITSGALSYCVQPIFDVTNQRLIAAEILARWYDSSGTLVPLKDYLPRLCALEWTAPYCAQLGAKRMQIGQALWRQFAIPIHFNIVAESLLIPEGFDQLSRHLADSTVPLSALVIELSEQNLLSANLNTLEATSGRLEALISSAPGITIALDDFGTGYSSLSYLHTFPIDTLKIDRSFVHDMSRNFRNMEIIRTIIMLAHNLKLDVIAEGVETAEQYAQLSALGCQFAQGFYFSRPVNGSDAALLIQKNHQW